MIKFSIPLPPPSKKNSNQLIYVKGKPRIIPNKQYNQYLKDVKIFLPNINTIDYPINLQCIFYVKDRRKRDVVNLLNAIQDVLVYHGILEDDNYQIVKTMDGSTIEIDKLNPRTEVYITKKEQ